MGSGVSGHYSGTRGASQPYADSYHVVPKMLKIDKKNPDVYNKETGYFKNPSARSLRESVNGNKIYQFNGKKAEGDFMYVMNKKGEIIFGKRVNPNNSSGRSPHPTLIGGKDPQAQCAGIINFKDGRIFRIDNQSGHFKPDIRSLGKIEEFMQKLYDENPLLFHKSSKWRLQ